MIELIKLEMKKMCRRRLTIIVTLCCFLVTVLFFLLPFWQYKAWDEKGTMLSGSEAVSYRKDCYDAVSGILTEERITNDLQEYQDIYNNPQNLITERGGEVSFTDEIYYGYLTPRSSYLKMLGNTYRNNGMGNLNIPSISLANGANFYQTRNVNVNEFIRNNPYLSDAEKSYWEAKNAKISEPYEYGYPLGWSNFGDTVQMLILCILGICIVVAPTFANEYQSGTDAIVLSTRFGKSKVIYAKIIAAAIFGTIVFVVNAAASLLLPLLTFGAGGGNLPLQIMNSYCPYSLTFAQAAFIIIGAAYIVMMGLLSITLLCSAKMKTSFTVLIIDVLIVFFPVFLDDGKNILWQHIVHILPYRTLSGLSLFTEYISYSFGSIVISLFGMIVIGYLIITFITLPLAGRSFKKHQVQ